MANNHFLASVYGYSNPLNNTAIIPLGTNQGMLNSFPSAGTRFYPSGGGSTINTVVMQTIIEVQPTGLQTKPIRFYTPTDVTTLNTAAT